MLRVICVSVVLLVMSCRFSDKRGTANESSGSESEAKLYQIDSPKPVTIFMEEVPTSYWGRPSYGDIHAKTLHESEQASSFLVKIDYHVLTRELAVYVAKRETPRITSCIVKLSHPKDSVVRRPELLFEKGKDFHVELRKRTVLEDGGREVEMRVDLTFHAAAYTHQDNSFKAGDYLHEKRTVKELLVRIDDVMHKYKYDRSRNDQIKDQDDFEKDRMMGFFGKKRLYCSNW